MSIRGLRFLSIRAERARLEFQLDHAAVALFEIEKFDIWPRAGRLFGADFRLEVGGALARILARDIDELAFRAERDHVVPRALVDERGLARLDDEGRQLLVCHLEALVPLLAVARRRSHDQSYRSAHWNECLVV